MRGRVRTVLVHGNGWGRTGGYQQGIGGCVRTASMTSMEMAGEKGPVDKQALADKSKLCCVKAFGCRNSCV